MTRTIKWNVESGEGTIEVPDDMGPAQIWMLVYQTVCDSVEMRWTDITDGSSTPDKYQGVLADTAEGPQSES